jgi:hypothetical protein
MLELRAVRGCMAESLAQLATWILPSAALPIALPVAVTIGGVREAAEIRSRRNRHVPSVVELVGTPSSMKTASAAAKISRRLAVRNEGCRRGVGLGQ